MEKYRLLCEGFHKESHYSHVPLDLGTCYHTIQVSLRHPEKVFFRELEKDGKVVGLFIGTLTPLFFSKRCQAQDLMFYVLPEHRGNSWFIRTLKEFESWSKSKGAVQVVLYTDTGINQEKLSKVLDTFQYRQTGYCFNKEL